MVVFLNKHETASNKEIYMLLLYKENNKLTFCEYDGDYIVFLGEDGKPHNEQISRYNQRYSNWGLTDNLGYRAIGFLSSDNKKHRIEDLLAAVISYRDLYDEPIDEDMYKDMIGYNVPYEAEVVLAMDKTTNAFTFCTQAEIDNPKRRMNGLLTATRLYLPDGRLIVMDNAVIIHDLHHVNLNKYVNAKPYEDVKKIALEVLRDNLKGASGTTTSKQGYLPKYKEKELSNVLKYSVDLFKCVNPKIKNPASKIVYSMQPDFVVLHKSINSYNKDCLAIDYKIRRVVYTDVDGDRSPVSIGSYTPDKLKHSIEKLMQSSFPSLSTKTVDTVEIGYNSVIITYTDKFKAKLIKKD